MQYQLAPFDAERNKEGEKVIVPARAQLSGHKSLVLKKRDNGQWHHTEPQEQHELQGITEVKSHNAELRAHARNMHKQVVKDGCGRDPSTHVLQHNGRCLCEPRASVVAFFFLRQRQWQSVHEVYRKETMIVARTLLLSHTSLSRHSLMPPHSLKQTHSTASHRGSLIAYTPQAIVLHGVLRGTHALARLMRTFSFFSCPRGEKYLRTHPTKDEACGRGVRLLEPPHAMTRSTTSIVITGSCV